MPIRQRLKFAAVFAVVVFCVSATHAQSTGTVYGFGDSLTDNGRGFRIGAVNTDPAKDYVGGRSTNGPTWVEYLPGLLGQPSADPLANFFAVGGAETSGRPIDLLEQVSDFTQSSLPISGKDVAGVWIGVNNFWYRTYFGTIISANYQPAVSQAIGDVRAGLEHMSAAGLRNVVLVNLYDMSRITPENLTRDKGGVPGAVNPSYSPLASQITANYNDQLANLSIPGMNIYYVDNRLLMERVISNPSLYGFTSVSSDNSCLANSCATLSQTEQRKFMFMDFIHVSTAYEYLLAQYAANIINARESFSAQGDLAQGAGLAFSNTLLSRFDAYRRFNSAGQTNVPLKTGNPVSVFAQATYAGVDRNTRVTNNASNVAGMQADLAGFTAGAEYYATPNLLLGAAFNYFDTSADLGGLSRASIEFDSFQGAVFASYNAAHFFVDGAVTYGLNRYDLSRSGVVGDKLTASPDGNTLTVAGKTGYLFDYSAFRIGPVAEFSYANVRVDSYAEGGDPVLTLGVRDQQFDALTGGVGFQVRSTVPVAGGVVRPFLELTLQHDFLDGVREITSFGTVAPGLLINTSAGHDGDDLYGKVAGGFSLDLGGGLEGSVAGSSTFGRSYGDDFSVNAGLAYRF